MRLSKLILPLVFFFACGGGGPTEPDPPPTTITISVTPSLLDFGRLGLGATGDLTVTISSGGTSNARLSGNVTISGANFAPVGSDLSLSLNAGESKIIVVRFTSTVDGIFTGTLTITHNATNQTSPSSVQLLGTGEDQSDEINATIQSAWQLFEAGDLAAAETKFDSATTAASNVSAYEVLLAEAESGLGWTNAKQRSFALAKNDFSSSISRPSRETSTDLNSKAGLAFVHHTLNEFASAVQRALEVLAADPAYAFQYDSRVSHQSVRLVAAQSYYSLGDFQNAAAQLDLLDPSGAPHSTEPDELLQKIQELMGSI